MIPFYTRFPELGSRETRCVHVLNAGGPLPVGEYVFLELYCEDPGCDCRRVILQVTTAQAPQTVLATINYGWESTAFYTRWMHGDAQAGREITEACLDPLNPQSRYADHLLDVFREQLLSDSAYVTRLARHYEMFKATQRTRTEPAIPVPHSPCASMPEARGSRGNEAQTLKPHPVGGHSFESAPFEKPASPPMAIPEILRQLQRLPDKADFAPYETALLAATDQRATITPELIAALDRVSANPAHYLKEPENCLHLFAIYLLAQFRETRALEAFLRFFSLPDEQALDLAGDMVTENGAAVIASVCGGDPAPLLRLLHDEAANEFVRGQAIDGLLVQCVWGERPREAVIAEIRGLFSSLAKPGNSYVWAQLVSAVNDFNAFELLPEVRRAYAENLVDEGVIGLEDIDPAVKREPRGYTPPTREEEYRWFCERNAPIDVVNECSGWLCFRADRADRWPWAGDENNDQPESLDDIIDLPPRDFPEYIPPQPYLAPPKVGRNDPCPCGSGQKYKKCCGK